MDAHTVNVDYRRYRMATQGSDRRLKENIKTISQADSIKLIESLNPVSYRFRYDGNPGIGFIAQEVEEVERSLNLDWKLYK